jgi:hypothetical protein
LAPKVAWYPSKRAMTMATTVATRRPEREKYDETLRVKRRH